MLSCVVTSAGGTDHYGEVISVSVPSKLGNAQILSGHAESFMSLGEGNIVLNISHQSPEVIPVQRGECYVLNSEVIIIL